MIILRTLKHISSLNIVASILLFLTAILAALIANSSLSPIYQDFLLQELHLRVGNFNLLSHGGHPLKMIEFINDCLMTVFFLAVGLEIKRELLVGELSSFRKAALPFVAACGGMVVPVLIYSLLVISGTPETRGMAIPMATDIAFSLGVLSLLGKRVPLSLKIFLTAFAVVDDIGGILVIALFYSTDVAYGYLIVAAILYIFLYYMGKLGVTQKIFFLFFGIIIWYLFLQSGIHSTISGVILAFVINYAAYFAEIYRAGIESIPVGQYEAAEVLGYSKAQTFVKIILPQVVKRVLPPVTNETITLVKDTSMAFTISIAEMFTVAKQIGAAQTSVLPLLAAGVFYYIFNLVVASFMEYLEKKTSYYR